MKRKNIIILCIIVVLLCMISGAWYYKYNYMDTVTSYIKVEYTPPTENPFYDTYDDLRKMVSDRYSKPSVKFSFVSFENDSVAYSYTYNQCVDSHKHFTETMANLSPNITPDMDETKVQTERMLYEAQMQAYLELLNTHTTIISFTHIRKYDKEKFLKDIIGIGFNKEKIDKYIKENKMSFKWIDVY